MEFKFYLLSFYSTVSICWWRGAFFRSLFGTRASTCGSARPSSQLHWFYCSSRAWVASAATRKSVCTTSSSNTSLKSRLCSMKKQTESDKKSSTTRNLLSSKPKKKLNVRKMRLLPRARSRSLYRSRNQALNKSDDVGAKKASNKTRYFLWATVIKSCWRAKECESKFEDASMIILCKL